MGTCVTCSQCLAEVISWLLAASTQFNRKKRFLLLLLLMESLDEFIAIVIPFERIFQEKSDYELRAKWTLGKIPGSMVAVSFGHKLLQSPHQPALAI